MSGSGESVRRENGDNGDHLDKIDVSGQFKVKIMNGD